MAVYHGKSAKVDKGGVAVIQITEWTIESSVDLVEITDFGDTWKSNEAGIPSWTGSFAGMADPENTEQKAFMDGILSTPAKITDAKFHIDGTHYFSGNIWITSWSLPTGIADVAKITFNFQGDGQLSYT